jgi:hypothetical protein
MMKTLTTALFLAAVVLAPAAHADTHTGVGHSGKGQTHASVSDAPSPSVPSDWIQHILNQLLQHH